jgi:hypothetical protein
MTSFSSGSTYFKVVLLNNKVVLHSNEVLLQSISNSLGIVDKIPPRVKLLWIS